MEPIEPRAALPGHNDLHAIELPSRLNRHQRRAKAAKADRPERHFEFLGDGYGYRVLHPTKGWRRHTERRIDAVATTQAVLAGNLPWWHGAMARAAGLSRG